MSPSLLLVLLLLLLLLLCYCTDSIDLLQSTTAFASSCLGTATTVSQDFLNPDLIMHTAVWRWGSI